MDSLLDNPAVQAAIIPLLVAFVSALVLRKFAWYWSSVGFVIAFYTVVYLIVGFDLMPLTSTRKLIILGLITFVIGLALDRNSAQKSPVILIVSGLLACAALWIIWPALIRKDNIDLGIMAISTVFYVTWLNFSLLRIKTNNIKVTVGILALGIGTGVSALLGASALLGQLGSAIAAVAGAFIVLIWLFDDFKVGNNFVLPSAALCGYIGISAVVYASLPWYSLLPLILIPVAAQVIKVEKTAKYRQILLLCALILPLSGLSIFLTWQKAGAPPF